MSMQLEALSERARIATREALMHRPPIPEHLRKRLGLEVFFEGEERVFELSVAGERPQDAIAFSSVTVNSVTGTVGQVEVFPERWLVGAP